MFVSPRCRRDATIDYINAEVIETRLTVKDGLLTLPDGPAYRVLVLPEMSTMRPELLRKIRDLVLAGADVWGSPPVRSPSLQHYPDCDNEVRTLAAEMWGEEQGPALLCRSGSGGISRKRDRTPFGWAADFSSTAPLLYTHRKSQDADIYFVANQRPQEVVTTAAFRVQNRVPELWWPESGHVERAAVYGVGDDTTRVPLHLGPHGSVFVVFPPGRRTRDGLTSCSATAIRSSTPARPRARYRGHSHGCRRRA